MLFFQPDPWSVPAYITGLFALSAAIVAFLIARQMYKSGMLQAQAAGSASQAAVWKSNYEAEKVRADNLDNEKKDLLEARRQWEIEKGSLVSEFSQISQLYARKSVILEAMLPFYTNLANLAEGGQIGQYLQGIRHPIAPPFPGIHQTLPPEGKGK